MGAIFKLTRGMLRTSRAVIISFWLISLGITIMMPLLNENIKETITLLPLFSLFNYLILFSLPLIIAKVYHNLLLEEQPNSIGKFLPQAFKEDFRNG